MIKRLQVDVEVVHHVVVNQALTDLLNRWTMKYGAHSRASDLQLPVKVGLQEDESAFHVELESVDVANVEYNGLTQSPRAIMAIVSSGCLSLVLESVGVVHDYLQTLALNSCEISAGESLILGVAKSIVATINATWKLRDCSASKELSKIRHPTTLNMHGNDRSKYLRSVGDGILDVIGVPKLWGVEVKILFHWHHPVHGSENHNRRGR